MIFHFLSLAVIFLPFAATTINVEIITVLPLNYSVASTLVLTRGAFELAVDAANRRYQPFLNVSLRFLYNPAHQNCDDEADDAISPLAEYYYKHTNPKSVYAMVSSICTDQTGIQSVATGKRHQIVIKYPSLLIQNQLRKFLSSFVNDTM